MSLRDNIMKKRSRTGERLFALFLIGAFLFNYPVLALFSQDGRLFGIPILYLFIFISWSALIGLATLLIQRR